MSYRAELDDIRKLLNPSDLQYVQAHSKSLRPGEFMPLSAKYGAGSFNGASNTVKFVAAATLAAVPILSIAYWYIKTHKKKQ